MRAEAAAPQPDLLAGLADALQAMPSPVLVTQADDRIRWVNAALCDSTGYRAEELLGQPSALLEVADEPLLYQALRAAMRAGTPWRGVVPLCRADGSCYDDDRRSTPLRDRNGVVTGHVWLGDDVTQRERDQAHLRHSEATLRRLVDSAPDTILVTDADGLIVRANPHVQDMLGYSPAELEGMHLKQLMAPSVASRHEGYMRAHRAGRHGMTVDGRDVQAIRKDGTVIDVHVRVSEMPYRNGRHFVGFMRDMSAHRRAEAALRQSEERLRKFYDLSTLGIALTDMGGRFLDFNHAFAQLTGHDAASLRKLSYWDLTPPAYEADELRNLQSLQQVGRYGPYEKHYRCRNGELRPVRLNGVRIDLDGQPCIWSIVEDLTERRAAEAEHARLQRQLTQAQKMEALGQLTGGIAHDFNNMLAGILGLSALALERHVHEADGKLASYLEQIIRLGERGRDLIDRLVRFARPVPAQPASARPLLPVVEEVLRMLESALPPALRVTLQVQPGLPAARFVELDLHQVLTNLVINARDAMSGCGTVAVEVSHGELPACDCSSCGRRVQGRFVVLRVRDQGTGMSPGVLSRAFDPFFTTKDVGKGTGLGLAMVHSLVHQCGGHVVVTSAVGQGSSFDVLLRAADPLAANDLGGPLAAGAA